MDIPQAALQVSAAFSGQPNFARFTLRALPDSAVERGEFTGYAGFTGPFSRWVDDAMLIPANPWGSVVRDLTQPSVRVLRITADGNITVDALGGIAATDYVRLRRVRDVNDKPVSGVFRVTAVNGLVLTVAGLTGVTANESGTLRKDLLLFAPYLQISVNRVVSRKIGSPFEKYRGRRSKRRA